MKTADFFIQRLKQWGVKRIFGYSGDGINGVIGAIDRSSSRSRPIRRSTLPPHISLKEARKFMFAMTGDKEMHVIRDTARQVINAVLHRHEAD